MIIGDPTRPSFDIPPSSASPTGIEDAEGSFLTLMLTQLQNQDPVDPMDNGEFLSQLAAFETASGIRDLEASFSQLADALYASQTLQSASLVGRSVTTQTGTAVLEGGEAVSGRVPLDGATEALTLDVLDAAGGLVRRLELGAAGGPTDFAWDGRDAAGRRAPDGLYTVQAYAGSGDDTVTVPVEIATRVQSVLLGGSGGGVELALANGQRVAVGDVTEIS